MTGPHDHPWEEVVKSADRAIAKGGTVFFKWSCQKCGSRQTFDVPDTFTIALVRAAQDRGAMPYVNIQRARITRELTSIIHQAS